MSRTTFMRIAAISTLVLGLLVVAWVAWTFYYGEPFTGYVAQERQRGAVSRFEARLGSTPVQSTGGRQKGVQCPLGARSYHVTVGQPWALITIPRLGLNRVAVMQGVEDVASELETGPGHYPSTSNPCTGKTVGIAGHRTTYGAWFRHIDDLRPGDRIYLRMPYGRYIYEVVGHKVVEPTDVSVLDNVKHEQLVLSACNPPYSAAQRYVVFAKLLD